MKLVQLFLTFIFLLVLGPVKAQNCDWATVPGQNGDPAILDLLTGNWERAGSEALKASANTASNVNDPLSGTSQSILFLLKATDYKTALAKAKTLVPRDSAGGIIDSMQFAKNVVYSGLASLLSGDYPAASKSMAYARVHDANARACGAGDYELIARYLDEYEKGQQPMFAHFNGGLFDFVRTKMKWKLDAPNPQGYDDMLRKVMRLVAYTDGKSRVYLELLGDMVVSHDNSFFAKYVGSLAYMRAAMLSENSLEIKEYERKALFALEAPRTSEIRFDLYRFTQMKKSLLADVETAEKQIDDLKADGKVWTAGNTLEEIVFFKDEAGVLGPKLKGAREKEFARTQEIRKFAEEVDPKTVKSDVRFNQFAIILILLIIGMAVYMWLRLRHATRQRGD